MFSPPSNDPCSSISVANYWIYFDEILFAIKLLDFTTLLAFVCHVFKCFNRKHLEFFNFAKVMREMHHQRQTRWIFFFAIAVPVRSQIYLKLRTSRIFSNTYSQKTNFLSAHILSQVKQA